MSRPITEEEQALLANALRLPRPQDLPDLPPDDPLAPEWSAFKRQVGRLLAEGHEGRFALVKGGEVINLWDTRRDAHQAGLGRFGLAPFLVQEIRPVMRPPRVGYSRLCRD